MKKFNVKSLSALALAICVTVGSLPLATLITAAGEGYVSDPTSSTDTVAEESSETKNYALSAIQSASLDIDVDGDGRLDYVSLGASNVNGYGLQGYLPDGVTPENKFQNNVYGYRMCPEGSYPDLLRDYYEAQGIAVDMHQLGISSMRAEELRYLLDDSYAGDAYTEWRFTGGTSWFIQATGSLEATKADYRTSIANADLITLDIGVNNFGVYLSNEITSPGWLGHDVSAIDSEYVVYYDQLAEWLLAEVPELAGYKDMIDTVAYAYLGFISNFDKSVEKIRELNPDATIVVVPVQCIIPDLKLDMNGSIIDLGAVVSELTNAANIYTAHLSPYHNEYYYASSIREDGKARVEFYIDVIKTYSGDLDVYGADKANLLDCFNVYDNNINVTSALQQMLAAEYSAQLSAANLTVEQFVQLGDLGYFEASGYESYLLIYNGYLNALDATYDAFAQIMKIGADHDTINIAEYTGAAGNTVLQAIGDILIGAAQKAFMTGERTVVPEDLAEYIAAKYEISAAAVETVLAFGVRSDIGNSFFGHPSLAGHKEVADAVIYAIENETTGINFAADYAGGLADKLIAAYKLADDLGYVDKAKDAAAAAIKDRIDGLKLDTLAAIDRFAASVIDYIGEKKENIAACIDKAMDAAAVILEKLGDLVNEQ